MATGAGARIGPSMAVVFFQTLPFFALIGLGYGAGRRGFFGPEATAALTKFVFYFALSAMLFRFAVQLDLGDLFNWPFVWAYLCATGAVFLIGLVVALLRGCRLEEAAIEGQCSAIGNTGFLGVPLLALLLGPAAIGPVMFVLAIDMIVFGSLIVILITARRDGRLRPAIIGTVVGGLLRNPMIVSISLGLAWSAAGIGLPGPMLTFLDVLGSAATPGALFAIGASLAGKSAERLSVALWLSFGKLVLHPAAVAVCALMVFAVPRDQALVMIAAAALPVAGNIYIIAAHYNVAPQRVSTAILVSTVLSLLTVTWVLTQIAGA